MPRGFRFTIALAIACTGVPERTVLRSPAERFDDLDVVAFEVVPGASGAAPVDVPVRAINAFGASVPTDTIANVTVEAQDTAVEFDGFGYGSAEVGDVGWTNVDGGAVFAFERPFDRFGLDPVWPTGAAAPSFGVAVTTGALAAEAERVWWTGDGAPAHVVLVGDGPIAGLSRANADVDDFSEAVAWTGHTVFVLRGRGAGGMAWGTAFRAEGYTVAGAAMGDLSGDNLSDLAIAWVDDQGRGVLDVWEGDGRFGFTAAEANALDGKPISVAVADNDGVDVGQVTVLFEDARWGRFRTAAPGRYVPVGPAAPTEAVPLPADARLVSLGDANADGGDELAVAGSPDDLGGRELWVMDLSGTCSGNSPSCALVVDAFPDAGGRSFASGDADGDLLGDVLVGEPDGDVSALSVSERAWVATDLLDAPAPGLVDGLDYDGDGWLDIVSIGAAVRTWSGRGWPDERFWTPLEAPQQFVREVTVGPPVPLQLDGDPGTIEILSFELVNGRTRMSVLSYEVNQGRAVRLGFAELEPATDSPVEDLALCGNDLYVVADGALDRISFSNPEAPTVQASIDGSVTRVACGPTPSGGDVAVLEGDQIRYRTRNNLSAVGAPVEAAGVRNLAAGSFGGTPVVHTCTTPGCDVAFVDLGSSYSAFARSESTGTTFIDSAGEETVTVGSGALSIGDADGDGESDLLALDNPSGTLTVWRSTGGRLAPPVQMRLPGGLGAAAPTGPARTFDGDGDGTPDVWFVQADEDLVYVRSAPAPDATP